MFLITVLLPSVVDSQAGEDSGRSQPPEEGREPLAVVQPGFQVRDQQPELAAQFPPRGDVLGEEVVQLAPPLPDRRPVGVLGLAADHLLDHLLPDHLGRLEESPFDRLGVDERGEDLLQMLPVVGVEVTRLHLQGDEVGHQLHGLMLLELGLDGGPVDLRGGLQAAGLRIVLATYSASAATALAVSYQGSRGGGGGIALTTSQTFAPVPATALRSESSRSDFGGAALSRSVVPLSIVSPSIEPLSGGFEEPFPGSTRPGSEPGLVSFVRSGNRRTSGP